MKNNDESVLILAKYGLDPDTIATLVERDVTEIQATIVTNRGHLPDADLELRNEAKAFVRQCLSQARLFMEFGLPSQKMALIRSVLPTAMRALGADGEDTGETHAQLQVLFSEIRSVPPTHAPRNDPIDVESQAVAKSANDQDQIFGDSPL